MTEQKDAAAVRIFPPAIPLVIVLLGVAMQYWWPLQLDFVIPTPARYWLGGGIIAAAVLGLGFWAVFTVRSSGQSENPWKPTTQILEHGPFRVTRNPMYLQLVIICFGFSILLWNVWIFLFTPLCAWCLHHYAIKPEEAYLEDKFGEHYRAYRQRVRRWL
ncbi:MAG: isoprenylcysteine carboxylmethyltransferase family protein [Thioalkalispiraceae bacterium]|jgi:protein-S-isoprenylcysteine O-methyltransferase Ste14